MATKEQTAKLNQEADTRAAVKAITISSQKQAASTVTAAPKQEAKVSIETSTATAERLSSVITSSGVKAERVDAKETERNLQIDQVNTGINIKITQAQQILITQVPDTNPTVTTSQTADKPSLSVTSPIPSTTALRNTQRNQSDVTRAKQNLQRKCNHKYNTATKRCEFCKKHKDSHVYDI